MNKNIKYIIGIIVFLALVIALIIISSKKTPTDPLVTSDPINTDTTATTSDNSVTTSKKPVTSTNTTPAPVITPTTISDTDWTWQYTLLADGTKKAAPNTDKFVLSFAKDKAVSSTTDCNTLKSSYTGTDSSLVFKPFVSTKKACVGSFETQYSEQLSQVNSYTLIGDELKLNLAKDAGTMVFALKYKNLAPAPTNATLKLNNTAYTLASFNAYVVPSGVKYTLSFKNGLLNAKFCNAMSGEYTLDGSTIKGDIIGTQMFCSSPDNLMQIESAFGSIGSGATLTQDGSRLTITTMKGDTLIFSQIVE